MQHSMLRAPIAVLLAVVAPTCAEQIAANPIRKVVTLLQSMQSKVTEEGKKQEDLYEKFMCYCKTGTGDLTESVQAAQAKIESLTSSLKSSSEKKAQTEADLKEHTGSRDDAKDTMAKATAMRKKEAAVYAKYKSDADTNLAALSKAITAIETGVAGAFLQTQAASAVRAYAMESANLPDATREELLSFLSGGQSQGYVPQSGEITGILKQIEDEMTKDSADTTAQENGAIQNYEALMAAKKKEVATLQKQIEAEMTRVGNLGVSIASMSNDLEDTKESLSADEKFKLELATSCDTKTKDWEEIKRTRADELTALAETIKVLNDDDALELFKKTLPSASMSFVQYKSSRANIQARALALIKGARTATKSQLSAQPELDLISLALHGKKIGFEKVITMIDNMVTNLKKEQDDDSSKKEYCNTQLDQTDDKKKSLGNSISDSETSIAEMQGNIAELTEDIAALTAGVKALDKSVAEATDLRKQENAEYKELMSSDTNAKEVLKWAKNRLNKFYDPKMYKPPPAREMTEEERITVNMGGTLAPITPGGIAGTGIGASLVQISRHSGAPPPPPATFGAYTTKTGESHGVIAMVDLLIKDLDKEMAEADVNEKDAQKEYEQMMVESAEKRAADSKSITQKTAEKASTEESLQAEEDTKTSTGKELMGTMKYISSLHGECDWLLQYFDARKEARAGEVEALANAKAVLNGADYSFLQQAKPALGFMAKKV